MSAFLASILPIIVTLFIAFVTIFLLTNFFGESLIQERFATIDGLRGFLAFFVFISHSRIWYFYLRTGIWEGSPPSLLYDHMGSSSVAFFFMITAFLFFSKLISGRKNGIDWKKLYVSRILRLAPIYWFSVLIIFIIVFILSNGALKVPPISLARAVTHWLAFSVHGAPDLNGIENTATIDAGVTWTLPYEWFFYLSLPFFALAVGVFPPLPYLFLSLATLTFLMIFHPDIYPLLSFWGGIIAAYLVRLEVIRKFSERKYSSLLILCFISAAVMKFPSAWGLIPLLLLSLAFVLIACGNTMFGLLIHPISRTLGEMTYSVYLLHGIILYVTFKFIIGVNRAKLFSLPMHWTVISVISPILITVCFMTFRLVERPIMQRTSLVTNWLRKRTAN